MNILKKLQKSNKTMFTQEARWLIPYLLCWLTKQKGAGLRFGDCIAKHLWLQEEEEVK